jgi:hypothetical protein
MAPLMNDHAVLASNDKTKLCYYGVRKCESLEGPAIFLNWTDCKFFVGSEKADNIEFQSFERLVDAATYVMFQQGAVGNLVPAVVREQVQRAAGNRIPAIDREQLQNYDDNDDRQERLVRLKLARLKEIDDQANKPDNVSEDSSESPSNATSELQLSKGRRRSTQEFPIAVSGDGGGVAWKRS